MVLSCAYLGPRHWPYSYYLCCASDIAAVGTTVNFFSYDAVWAENRTHHLPDIELRVMPWTQRTLSCLKKIFYFQHVKLLQRPHQSLIYWENQLHNILIHRYASKVNIFITYIQTNSVACVESLALIIMFYIVYIEWDTLFYILGYTAK